MPDSSYQRGTVDQANLLASRPISAAEWGRGGHLQNHVRGRGRVLVPAMKPEHTALVKSSYTYALRIVPNYNALVRRWRVVARCDSEITVTVNGVSATSPAPGDFSTTLDYLSLPRGITIEEVLASQSAAEFGAKITIESTDADLNIDSIECFELPRAVVAADANELGVDIAPFRASLPIQASVYENLYAGAMDEDAGRRVLFQWAAPFEVGGSVSTTYAASTSADAWSDVFAVGRSCIARKKFNDGDYTTCSARAFAWVTPGAKGRVRISSANGISDSVLIENAAPAWSSAIAVPILCEDLSIASGIPGAGYDEVKVQILAESGTIYLASAMLNE